MLIAKMMKSSKAFLDVILAVNLIQSFDGSLDLFTWKIMLQILDANGTDFGRPNWTAIQGILPPVIVS